MCFTIQAYTAQEDDGQYRPQPQYQAQAPPQPQYRPQPQYQAQPQQKQPEDYDVSYQVLTVCKVAGQAT